MPRRHCLTADGYYRSGDLGATLPGGRFVFLARMGDAPRLGGFLVSPAEIEEAVQTAPGSPASRSQIRKSRLRDMAGALLD